MKGDNVKVGDTIVCWRASMFLPKNYTAKVLAIGRSKWGYPLFMVKGGLFNTTKIIDADTIYFEGSLETEN